MKNKNDKPLNFQLFFEFLYQKLYFSDAIICKILKLTLNYKAHIIAYVCVFIYY